jgi:hypothetical protein
MLIRTSKAISSVAAVLVGAAMSLLAGAAHEPAYALVGIQCGAPINSVLRLEPVASSTSSVAFVNLVNVNIGVPAGTTRCIKVVFTAEASCRGPTSIVDNCIVRALDNGVEMNPQGGGALVLLSEDGTANGHAYEWVSRAGAGNHNIVIQRRVTNAATVFTVDDWTFDVQLHN